MELWEALVLGVVQGQTEFLPVSSSGHLVVFQRLLGLNSDNLAFGVAVHIGTVLSILTVYFSTFKSVFLEVVRYPFQRQMTPGVQLFKWLVVASIPTAAMGLGFKDQFESLFQNSSAVGACFIITGFMLFTVRSFGGGKGLQGVNDYQGVVHINIWRALIIGVAQGLAIAPGISRSGTTISAGLFVGLDRGLAALFSFMMSVPAILGASLLELNDVASWDEQTIQIMLVGVFASYLSGLLGMWFVLQFVRQGRLQFFSYYLWGLGLMVLFFL